MGLIKAFSGALGGTMADQWKDFIYCDSMSSDILVCKGRKQTSKRSSNTKGEENVIPDGSKVVVSEGQAMVIVEDGKVVDVCAEPGGYEYKTGTTPSVFAESFLAGLKGAAKETWSRFQYGGGAGKDQRVYYFNLKEIMGNKYGTATPIPFRVVDTNIGLDMDISIRCNGEFSYRIINPMLFYTNVCGNVSNTYDRSEIDSMLKSELLSSLQLVLGRISEMGIRYSAITLHTEEMTDILNEKLTAKWTQLRGLEIVSFNINSLSVPKEDEDLIKNYQKKAMLRDPGMADAALRDAAAEAMVAAANNANGAMAGFMGMNMATGTAGNIFSSAQAAPAPAPAPAPAAPAAGGWTCSCGAVNSGKFCSNCGSAKPEDETWTCSCGSVNKGKFCPNCGSKKPEGPAKCGNCGWTASDPAATPKFCPECGTKL